MAAKVCTVSGCDRKYVAKGYCNAHWMRARKGKPLDTPLRLVGLSKRRDDQGRKKCSSCGEWLSASEFHPKKGISDGLYAKCRTCLLRYNRAVKYGVTIECIDEMLIEQGGSCSICRRPISDDYHVDHDHACCAGYKSCGRCVRGLLCSGCNLMLGMAKDSIPTLEAAIAYLRGN